jgi:exodeoxyribonuclease III
MKILSYNINGLNSFYKKGLFDKLFNDFNDVDIFCFQEVKAQPDDVKKIMANYPDFLYLSNENSIKKGYAGVLIIIRNTDFDTLNGWSDNLEPEPTDPDMLKYWGGRSAMIAFDDFCLYNIYTPNSKNKEELRKLFDKTLIERLNKVKKPVVIVGDLNVCPTKYDYWGKYEKVINTMPGLMQFEIDGYNQICENCNLTNVYRFLHEDGRNYTFYPNSKGLKNLQGNKGWILDHVLISNELTPHIKGYEVLSGYNGEDHSPIIFEIE